VKAVLACPSCSETTFGRHSGCQRDCGRRVAQIVQSDSWETSQLKYHFEMLGEIIGMDWVSRRRFEDQVTALWTQTVGALAFVCRSRRSATIQRCNLIGRRLRERFVSQKHHLPSSLRTLRTTLTVCRVQSMSCHFSPKYSLGRIPVVSATASTGPFGVGRAAFINVCACSTLSARISPLDRCGILTPSAGFSRSRRHCNACRMADLNTTCV